MIRVKLMSILVNDQSRARRFYTDVLGFRIKHDIRSAKRPGSRSSRPTMPGASSSCSNRPVIPPQSRCSKRFTRTAFRWRNSTPKTSPPSSSA